MKRERHHGQESLPNPTPPVQLPLLCLKCEIVDDKRNVHTVPDCDIMEQLYSNSSPVQKRREYAEYSKRLLRMATALVPGPSKTTAVFVGNIPYDVTEADVQAHLSQLVKVESFRMMFESETMQPKGYGFCNFSGLETALAAIEVLGNREFHGRLLRLHLAHSLGGMSARGVSTGGAPGKKSTVFVGNIPYDATEDDVRGHLSQGGKVRSFRMVFDKESMQSRGYGFCDFADPETAVAAIKVLSEREYCGRLLRLDLADRGMPARGVPKGGEPGKKSTVFVGNIPYDATEDDVRGHLSQGGKVESFHIVFDKETMQPRGYGYCDFADPETAVAAIKVLSEREYRGRLLRLDLADRGMPARGVSKGGERGRSQRR